MAGTYSRFNAAKVREKLHFAMEMGAAVDETERVQFQFAPTTVWPPGTVVDQDGNAMDPTIKPLITRPDPVIKPVGMRFDRAKPEEIPVGNFTSARLTLTILDVDFPDVEDAIEVLAGGDTYVIMYQQPPLALFDMGVHVFVAFARDET